MKKTYEDGYIVGSRGSVGSSFVAFLCGISEVNPLPAHYYCKHCKHVEFVDPKQDDYHEDGYDLPTTICPTCGKQMEGEGHNIPFETFLGFEGDPKVPDIDLNFSGDYQARAHNFIRDKFGKTHTFRSGTISTVAEKTAMGYVRNYFEMTQPDDIPKDSFINAIAMRCTDVKRTTGQHPGGIIIVPKEYDIHDFAPYNHPADKIDMDWYTTHFDFNSMHDQLLKFDILGHDDPTSLLMLQNMTGKNIKDIPFHDDQVLKLYNSLESVDVKPDDIMGVTIASIGLPEFGTPFARRMLYDAKPNSFGDLVRICGLAHGTNV
ncbi:hypothetical protein FACS1894166_12860 [Bacilli bacterium]|nr:hypothetical protein FACS1894166_12860 [Bacilli bacterium]